MKYNLVGQRFGKLVVIEQTTKDTLSKNKGIYWLCRCDCGNTHKATTYMLRKGQVKSCGCLRPGLPAKDLTHRRFGKLTVIKRVDKQDKKLSGIYVYWLCKCDCGKEITTRGSSLKYGSSRSCGCLSRTQVSDTHWQGYKGLSATYFNKVKRSAAYRNIPFDITIEDAWKQFVAQDGRCILSNIELVILGKGDIGYERNCRQTASLDRIDSTVGYEITNIQWVHKDLNRMKGVLSQEEFISWCRRVVLYHGH